MEPQYEIFVTKDGTMCKKAIGENKVNYDFSALLTANIINLISKQGRAISFDHMDIRPMGPSALGIRGMKLKLEEGDEIVDLLVSHYPITGRIQSRGGSGRKIRGLGNKTKQ